MKEIEKKNHSTCKAVKRRLFLIDYNKAAQVKKIYIQLMLYFE